MMVTSNKDAAKIWAEIEKARNVTPKEDRGPNDLERRINDLFNLFIFASSCLFITLPPRYDIEH